VSKVGAITRRLSPVRWWGIRGACLSRDVWQSLSVVKEARPLSTRPIHKPSWLVLHVVSASRRTSWSPA